VRARRERGDGGAAAVEFALILPVFLVLVFGLISAGLAYFHKIGLAQDVREAGRYGATYVDSAGNNADDDPSGYVSDVLDALVMDASQSGDLRTTGTIPSSTLDPSDPDQVVCAAYIPVTGSATRETRGDAALPAGAGSYCYDDGLGSGATAGYPRVQVYAKGDSTWNLVVLPSGPKVTFASSAVYRYERWSQS
jgi:hypothetical protein